MGRPADVHGFDVAGTGVHEAATAGTVREARELRIHWQRKCSPADDGGAP